MLLRESCSIMPSSVGSSMLDSAAFIRFIPSVNDPVLYD
jgi:hypothetical protein